MRSKLRRAAPHLTVLFIIIIACFVGARLITGSKDEQCQELCTELQQRKVKITRMACICEDPETKKRNGYPFPGRYQ